MAEQTSEDPAQSVASTSSIPTEMLPLLAEIEAHADSDQFITLSVPIQDGTAAGDVVAMEETPSASQEQVPEKNYLKSRKKRKKMELYVREHRKFVYIGDEQKRWDQYRRELRVKDDQDFAKLLLDGFRKYTKIVQLVVGPTFGYPEIGSMDESSLQPKVKAKAETDSDELTDFIKAVQDGLAKESEEKENQNAPTQTAAEIECSSGDQGSLENQMPPEGERLPGEQQSSDQNSADDQSSSGET